MRSALRRLVRPTVGGIFALVSLLVVGGCATGKRTAYQPHQLRASVGSQLPRDKAGSVIVPFEVTAGMVSRAERYTRDYGSDHARAEALVRAITAADGFDVQWEPVTTTTARRTLEQGHGNCLSMTSLYIGLARAIGLSAFYVDASDRVNSLTREEELLVDTGHIAATVRTGQGWSLVDFTGEISSYRTFRVIDDVEALAHFYNNRGYELVSTAGPEASETEWTAALEDFTMATMVHADFARALNNRGVALSRLGRVREAEIAYARAVRTDENFVAPRHNLGNLHLRRDEFEQAIRWYGVAVRMQPKNPYLHYHMGLARYRLDDLDGAVEAFERAIALKHDYMEPRNLLAAAYRQQGRLEEAERVKQAAGERRSRTAARR